MVELTRHGEQDNLLICPLFGGIVLNWHATDCDIGLLFSVGNVPAEPFSIGL